MAQAHISLEMPHLSGTSGIEVEPSVKWVTPAPDHEGLAQL